MRNLVCMELRKALRNGWFFASLAVGCLIALASAARSVEAFFMYGFASFDAERYFQLSTSGTVCAWIGIGRLDTTFLPWLFYGIVPLLAVVPYAWSYRSEASSGYIAQVCTRASFGCYMGAKFFAAFVTAGCSIAIPLVLNYLVVACFIPAYVPDPGEGLSVPIEEHYPFSALFFTCPLAYAVLYTALDFFLCGSWAVVVCAASFFVRNRVVLLVGSYVLQYFLRYCNTTGVAERLFGTAGAYQLSLISMAWPVPSGDVPHAGIAVALGCAGLAIALLALRVVGRRDVA